MVDYLSRKRSKFKLRCCFKLRWFGLNYHAVFEDGGLNYILIKGWCYFVYTCFWWLCYYYLTGCRFTIDYYRLDILYIYYRLVPSRLDFLYLLGSPGREGMGGEGSCMFYISCNLIFYCEFICQGSCWYYWNILSLIGLLWINTDNYISTCSEILCNSSLLNSFSRLPPMKPTNF